MRSGAGSAPDSTRKESTKLHYSGALVSFPFAIGGPSLASASPLGLP